MKPRCRSIACAITTNHLEKIRFINKSFSNIPAKRLFKDYMSLTAKLDFFDNKVVEYLVNLINLHAGREKNVSFFDYSIPIIYVVLCLR